MDDEKAIRQFLRLALLAQDYEVIEAASSRQALDKALYYSGSIDLLLTDILLPDVNGYDLAVRLRARYPQLKVLFISGYVTSNAVRDCLSNRTAFLEKPFALETVLAIVRELIEDEYVSVDPDVAVCGASVAAASAL